MKTLLGMIAAGFIFSAALQASPSLSTIDACSSVAAPSECRIK